MRKLLLLLGCALVAGAPAAWAGGRPTLAQLEGDLMCPTCKGETLAESSAPEAQRIKRFILREIRAGKTKGQIEDRLVAEFGPGILAAPTRHGFDLLAWLLPLAGVLGGAVVLSVLARRWARAREPSPVAGAPELNGRPPLAPDLERRVDEELARFD